MNFKNIKTYFLIFAITCSKSLFAQPDDLLSIVEKKGDHPKEYVNNAFKSSRVIMGHSIEFIGKGVLDVRILHRFGLISQYQSARNLFGLDQASMRLGFDYGLTKGLTIGIGRSTFNKEFDGFIKYRLVQQSRGAKGTSPVSVVLVTGATYNDMPWEFPSRTNFLTSRMAFYNELIIGRKFSEGFSAQITPTHVHINLVNDSTFKNDVFALGVGARLKLSKRVAFVVDYQYLLKQNGEDATNIQFKDNTNALSMGFDIETGGHVFQLHFSNSKGMNEREFITNTTGTWGKGEVSFGFNLSRVFTVGKKKPSNPKI